MIEQVVRTTMSTGCPDDHIGGTYIKHVHQMVSKTKRRGIVSGADKFEATIKEAAAQAKVGVVVPTGFEPVFKP
jgi:hypothetical protein